MELLAEPSWFGWPFVLFVVALYMMCRMAYDGTLQHFYSVEGE